jgi:HEAT repeat protein
MRGLLVVLALMSTRCSSPAAKADPPLFEVLARSRAAVDAALDSQDSFRVEMESATLAQLVRDRFEEILAGLGSADAARQELAAFALGFSRNRAAMGPLEAAAESPNPALRAHAIAALGMLGFRDAPQEPFRKRLADEAWEVRLSALFGLRHCAGPDVPSSCIEALHRCLSDPMMGIRNETVLVLAKIGGAAPLEMILSLAVRDPEALVRQNAARALVEIGKPSEKILPALKEMCRDEDPRVRDAAEASLRHLESRRVDTPALDR